MSGATASQFAHPAAYAIGARLIRQMEGCSLRPVRDGDGWQIGYGCDWLPDGSRVTADTPPLADIDAAKTLLHALLLPRSAQVDALIHVAATDAQRGALYDFAWNEGVEALAGSTLLRLFNAGDVPGAAAQFGEWDLADGVVLTDLQKRRALERAIFLGLTTA